MASLYFYHIKFFFIKYQLYSKYFWTANKVNNRMSSKKPVDTMVWKIWRTPYFIYKHTLYRKEENNKQNNNNMCLYGLQGV